MKHDILVVGGGPAGVGAALAAAENGAKTLLLERTGRLGGTAVQSLVGPFMGGVSSRYKEKILTALGGHTGDFRKMDLQLYDLLSASGVEIQLHAGVHQPIQKGKRVVGVTADLPDGPADFSADAVIDATGDGTVAFRAGVPFEIGRDEDGLTQPMSIMFTIDHIAPESRFLCHSEEMAREVSIGGRSWEELTLEAGNRGELPSLVGVVRLYAGLYPDESIVNAAQINFLNGTSASDLTRAEIECRRQAWQILEFLRRTLPGYENARISSMPAAVGVRETRRFEGCARLEKADCLSGRVFDDAVVFDAVFGIDIHNPSGGGQAAGRRDFATGSAERVQPYTIPYGVMVPREIDGLLFTGRCISASHEALASCRVMCIAMALGGAAGSAAAYAVRQGIPLRRVPVHRLAEQLRARP